MFASVDHVAVPEELRDQIAKISPIVLAGEHLVPVSEVFHDVLPAGGLQRGWFVKMRGTGSVRALSWGLVAKASQAGGWVAVVDVCGINLSAAHELGVAIERVLVIECPDRTQWSTVIASLIGAVDVVVFGAPQHRVTPSEVRRMVSRARERGSVLFELDDHSDHNRTPGRNSGIDAGVHDIEFTTSTVAWNGLGEGYGYVAERHMKVEAAGRRIGGRSRCAHFGLPAADGTICRLQEQSHLRAV